MNDLNSIISHFSHEGTVGNVSPLGAGLINDSYKVVTTEADAPDYVLQRINHVIFTDVDMLQANIEAVTREDVAQLFIQHPGDQAQGCISGLLGMSGLFQTHPPIEERIRILEQF